MASHLKRILGMWLGSALARSGQGVAMSRVCMWILAVTVALGLNMLIGSGTVDARTRSENTDVVVLGELPVQAQSTYRLILSGGPFRFTRKDGSVFGNRERQLPRMTRGYYREYTVETPGSADRGARRIVCGGLQPTSPDACYYTQDHYTSFRRIVQ